MEILSEPDGNNPDMLRSYSWADLVNIDNDLPDTTYTQDLAKVERQWMEPSLGPTCYAYATPCYGKIGPTTVGPSNLKISLKSWSNLLKIM